MLLTFIPTTKIPVGWPFVNVFVNMFFHFLRLLCVCVFCVHVYEPPLYLFYNIIPGKNLEIIYRLCQHGS